MADTTDYEEIARFLKQYSEENNINIEMFNLNRRDIKVEEKNINEIDLEQEQNLEIMIEKASKDHFKEISFNSSAILSAIWVLVFLGEADYGLNAILLLPFKRKEYSNLDEVNRRIRKLKEEKSK